MIYAEYRNDNVHARVSPDATADTDAEDLGNRHWDLRLDTERGAVVIRDADLENGAIAFTSPQHQKLTVFTPGHLPDALVEDMKGKPLGAIIAIPGLRSSVIVKKATSLAREIDDPSSKVRGDTHFNRLVLELDGPAVNLQLPSLEIRFVLRGKVVNVAHAGGLISPLDLERLSSAA